MKIGTFHGTTDLVSEELRSTFIVNGIEKSEGQVLFTMHSNC